MEMKNSHKDRPLFTEEAAKEAKKAPGPGNYNPKKASEKRVFSSQLGTMDRPMFTKDCEKQAEKVPGPTNYKPNAKFL